MSSDSMHPVAPSTSPLSELKLCSTCGSSVKLFSSGEYQCLSSHNQAGISLINGDPVFKERDCIKQRSATDGLGIGQQPESAKNCGRQGFWWKPKPPEPVAGSWQPIQSADVTKFGPDGGSVKVGKSTMEL